MLSHFSRVQLSATPCTMAHQAPLSMSFSRQEYRSGLPSPSPVIKNEVREVKSLSHIWLSATPWTAAYQVPPSMGFSRQEYWSGVPLPSPVGISKYAEIRAKQKVSLDVQQPWAFIGNKWLMSNHQFHIRINIHKIIFLLWLESTNDAQKPSVFHIHTYLCIHNLYSYFIQK